MKSPVLMKIENAYLSLLRLVVLAAATILLVVAVICGVRALKGMTAGEGEEAEVAKVSQEEVLKALDEAKPEAPTARPGKATAPAAADPFKDQVERGTKAIQAFVKTHGKGLEANEDHLKQVLHNRINALDEGEAQRAYADGLALTLETLLVKPEVIARIKPAGAAPAPVQPAMPAQADADIAPDAPAQVAPAFKVSPFDVVDGILEKYQQLFTAKQAEEARKADESKTAAAIAKVEAQQSLYYAAACFGIFLLVVFLSIVIKIERNLRAMIPVENKEQG